MKPIGINYAHDEWGPIPGTRKMPKEVLLKHFDGTALAIMCDQVNDKQSTVVEYGTDDGEEDLRTPLMLPQVPYSAFAHINLFSWGHVQDTNRLTYPGKQCEYKNPALLKYATADQQLKLAARIPHIWVVYVKPPRELALRPLFGGRFLRGVLVEAGITNPDKYLQFGPASYLLYNDIDSMHMCLVAYPTAEGLANYIRQYNIDCASREDMFTYGNSALDKEIWAGCQADEVVRKGIQH